MIQIIINIPGQELLTYEVREAVIITHSDEGDIDFDGNATPEFIKKIIAKHGLEKYKRTRTQMLLADNVPSVAREPRAVEIKVNPFHLVAGTEE